MTISDGLREFKAYCYNKGLLPRSIDNYSAFIMMFIKSVGDLPLNTIDADLIGRYVESLYKKNLSKATMNTYLRHLKIFLRWCGKRGYVNEFLYQELILPRQPQKVLIIYDDEQIKEIFEAIDNTVLWIRYRNCCIVALMLDSGLRLQEVINIKRDDLNLKTKVLKVKGKGENERLVPLGKITLYYLDLYQDNISKISAANKGDFFFIRRNGEAITRDVIKQLMQKLANRLPFEISAHKLRHNFATNYCIDEYYKVGNMDIYKLKLLLGHEDLKTTMRYVHLANQIVISKTDISHLDKIYL